MDLMLAFSSKICGVWSCHFYALSYVGLVFSDLSYLAVRSLWMTFCWPFLWDLSCLLLPWYCLLYGWSFIQLFQLFSDICVFGICHLYGYFLRRAMTQCWWRIAFPIYFKCGWHTIFVSLSFYMTNKQADVLHCGRFAFEVINKCLDMFIIGHSKFEIQGLRRAEGTK